MGHICVEVDENLNALEWEELVSSYFHPSSMLVPYSSLLVTVGWFVKIDNPGCGIPNVREANKSIKKSKSSKFSSQSNTCPKLQDLINMRGGGPFPSPTGAVGHIFVEVDENSPIMLQSGQNQLLLISTHHPCWSHIAQHWQQQEGL